MNKKYQGRQKQLYNYTNKKSYMHMRNKKNLVKKELEEPEKLKVREKLEELKEQKGLRKQEEFGVKRRQKVLTNL
jgi:hypothetical protein